LNVEGQKPSSKYFWNKFDLKKMFYKEEDDEEHLMMSMYGGGTSTRKHGSGASSSSSEQSPEYHAFQPKLTIANDFDGCKHCGASSEYIISNDMHGDVCTNCGTHVDIGTAQASSTFREDIEFDKGANRPTKVGRHISYDEGLYGAYLLASAEDPNNVANGLSSRAQARLQRQMGAKRRAQLRINNLMSALKVPARLAGEVMFLVTQMAERTDIEILSSKKRKKTSSSAEPTVSSDDSATPSPTLSLESPNDFEPQQSAVYNTSTGQLIEEDDEEFYSDDEIFGMPNEEVKKESSPSYAIPDTPIDEKERNMNLLKQRLQSTLFCNSKNKIEEKPKENNAILKFRYTREKWIDGVIAGALYIICRREKLPITLLDLSELLGYSIFELGKRYKEVCSALQIKVDKLDLEVLCDRMANEFNDCFEDDNGNINKTIKTDVILRMRRIVRVAIKECLDTGRRPIGLVGAALKLAMESCDINLSFDDVAQAMNTGKSSLRERYNELRQLMLSLSKELPWAHEITNKSLLRHLPFILDFAEQLRDIHRTKIEDTNTNDITDLNSPTSSVSTMDFPKIETSENQLVPNEIIKSSLLRLENQPMTKGKQSKEIALINSQLSQPLPPAFLRSLLSKEIRKQKVENAKLRIHNAVLGSHVKSEGEAQPITSNNPLDQEDLQIERLLLEGVSEQDLICGYTHSSKLPMHLGRDGVDRGEELTDMDISTAELNSMIRSKEEVASLIQIRNELGEDIDAEQSIKKACKKRKKEEDDDNCISATLLDPSLKKRK